MRHYETSIIADNGFNADATTFPPVGGTGFVSFRITEPGEPGYSAPLTIRLPFSFAEKAARIAAAINEIMDDKDGWLDMSTAPEDGTEILVCVRQHNRPDGKIVQAVVWFENGDWRLDDDEKGRAHPPLCWRHLPALRTSDAAPVAMPEAAE